MKITRLNLPVMSSWIEENSLRLDPAPYLSGSFEAKVILTLLSVKKEPLHELTKGHKGGIYNGPQFVRNYVTDPKDGVPFLRGSSMLLADLSNIDLLRRKDAESSKLSYLRLEEGMTLISCSGTIGRMVYTRSDMAGIWSSQDILKVVPDPEKILPGYLYAYLSSKFGIPQIVSGTYGAIIRHIEPSHIQDLLVPRLGEAIEAEVHSLISKAAENRVQAADLIKESNQEVLGFFGIDLPKRDIEYSRPSTTFPSSSCLLNRLDGYYFASWNADAEAAFNKSGSVSLGDVVKDLYIPGIFKRIYASDSQHGYPYLTGADVYQLTPKSDQVLTKQVAKKYRLILRKGMILIQDSGQLGGLIGKPVAVGEYLDGFACTNNMVRIEPHTEFDQGYIFALLNTQYGLRLVTREASGSSIPHLEEKRIKSIKIPWASDSNRKLLAHKILKARDLRDQACWLEQEATDLVEKAIEEGANG